MRAVEISPPKMTTIPEKRRLKKKCEIEMRHRDIDLNRLSVMTNIYQSMELKSYNYRIENCAVELFQYS